MKTWMVTAVFVAACGGGGGTPSESTVPADPAAPAEPTTAREQPDQFVSNDAADQPARVDAVQPPAAQDEPAEPTTTAHANEVVHMATGVPVCDIPFNKYVACIVEKLPEAGRQSAVDALRESAEAWRQAASSEEGRKALAEACEAAAGAWQQSAEAMGCTW